MAVKKKRSIRYIIAVLVGSFFIAALLSSGAEATLRFLPVSVTWILLIFVILIGIVADIIGIAVTAADEAPHHARAAKKVFGARQSVFLIKKADRVANIANDIIGDITGTLAGAMGANIIISLVSRNPQMENWRVLLNVLLLALIASCTVTGKAWGKTYAINEANRIVAFTGRVLAGFEKIIRLDFAKGSQKGGK